MAAKKRGGLGRGIGALIPQHSSGERPVDVYFGGDSVPAKGAAAEAAGVAEAAAGAGASGGGGSADVAAGAAPRSGMFDAASRASGVDVSRETSAVGGLREVPGARLAELNVYDIEPNPDQPRHEFDEEALEELTHSIREFGVFQPVVVREKEQPEPGEPRYQLIMGERRLRASKRAGRSTIPAVVRGTADEHMLRDALLENLHRAQLNPLEEASAYQQLLQDFGITQEQLAERIGRSRPQISNTIRLLKLPEPVQARVAAGVLSAGHARAILSLDGDAEAMQRLADKIVNEGLSVREAESAAGKTERVRRPKTRAGGVQTQLNEIVERLGDRFNTRVSIKLGKKRGNIQIDFATFEDLRRILAEMGDQGFN